MSKHEHGESFAHPNTFQNQLVLDTNHPIQGLEHLGYSLWQSEGETSIPLLQRMEGTLPLELLLAILKDHLHMERKIESSDLKSVKVSPHNLAIWQIVFKENLDEIAPHLTPPVDENYHGTTGSGDKTHDEYVGGMNSSLNVAWDELENIVLGQHVISDARTMAVGIVDRGKISPESGASHLDVLASMVKHGDEVKAVAISMTEDANQEVTVFDLVSALYNKKLTDQVQVINISQGYYSAHANPVLEKALRKLNKPIVCSAGNKNGEKNDVPHWPSSFCATIPNVISVGSLTKRRNREVPAEASNSGQDQVTLFARGNWTDKLQGTSFSAAWISRLIALSFAKQKGVTFEMDHFINHLKTDFANLRVEEGEKKESATRLRIFPDN